MDYVSARSSRDDWDLLQGAVDIHIHHAPDLYPRIQDPIELAQDARAAGMRAVCIKRHNFPTAGLAQMAHKIVPEVDVFGSIACNRQVGGLNPLAVEAAIKYGVRQVWLPTIRFDKPRDRDRISRSARKGPYHKRWYFRLCYEAAAH